MNEQLYIIEENSLVSDIVARDYRTADVFRKYDIDFCCGGKWALEMACKNKGLDTEAIVKELQQTVRNISISPVLPFNEWPLDFLADYIVYVHHAYLRRAFPEAKAHLDKFIAGHRKKYPYLDELEQQFLSLTRITIPHLKQEEETIFPYIKQVNRAAQNKEAYGGLLVRTLRKPVEEIMHFEHRTTSKILHRFRELTNNYTPPENACISHRVTFLKLRELDRDLVQHMHLENNILFPRAIAIEKELLGKNDR